MILAEAVGAMDIVIVLLYLFAVAYLGWLGYRRTQSASDYLVAGRKAHPAVMALSYGATFISTSAIVGFGGVAGMFGMSLLWLTFFNIFVGIFIAFVFLGGPTRRIGHRLDAHTFPELIGRRYQSRFLQVFCGLVIFAFMPLYAAAVLIGGSEFFATAFGIDYTVALLVFSVIVAAYVIAGGLKGVMYTDALQGSIMFVGMLVLICFTYVKVGGVAAGHGALTQLTSLVPSALKDMGHTGWTGTPKFGWGSHAFDLWWIVFTTIVLGVGIGVLAQPQLIVRFMTVKSKRELNRAVMVGGVFIMMMTGVAFTVGALSNVYFSQHGKPFYGTVVTMIDAQKGHAILQVMQKDAAGKWTDVKDKKVPVVLDGQIKVEQSGQPEVVAGRSLSIVYAGGNAEQIIPTYIKTALPHWFGIVFLLTLLAAAMSTLSSQFHTLGTALGRDVVEQITRSRGRSIGATRLGMIVGILIAVLLSYYFRGGTKGFYIVARATAIFFGLCAATFLPSFVGGLFFKGMTRVAAIASMITGCLASVLWLLFFKQKEAGDIGLVQLLTGGKRSLLMNFPNWPEVDPLVIALPLSVLVAVAVSMFTRPPDEAHLRTCFERNDPAGR